jgi:DNA-binding CsgD family transcriptional regulator
MASGNKLITAALAGLTPRQREVLVARFGLEKGGCETLAKIGDRLGITRERVRQIENVGLALAKTNIVRDAEIAGLLEAVKKHISATGGVMRRTAAAEYADSLAAELTANRLDFLSEASGTFTLQPEGDDYHPFYFVSNQDRKAAFALVENWVKTLRARKSKVLADSYDVHLAAFMKEMGVDRKIAENYLGISKRVAANPYGDKGLREWPEISPSTIRDKIYLILKKRGEALHFEDIARAINGAQFDRRKALTATVHNELIKDKRFALVGRGVYGLTEHGYEQGTAREAIAHILKRGPLPAEEVWPKWARSISSARILF